MADEFAAGGCGRGGVVVLLGWARGFGGLMSDPLFVVGRLGADAAVVGLQVDEVVVEHAADDEEEALNQ